jgi:phage terminase large subunit
MTATLDPSAIREALEFLEPHERDRVSELIAEIKGQLPTEPLVEYQHRPLEFCADVLGVSRNTLVWSLNGYGADYQWDGTSDPIAAVFLAVAAGRRVIGVESATTTGKTFLGACIVLWFLGCFKNATVVTVAPKEKQLELHIWKEIGKLWPGFKARFPSAELTHLRIRMLPNSDAWAAHGFIAGVAANEVEGSATKAQGFHAEHMLIVYEETPGISPAIMMAFRQTCRAPHNIRIGFGNPDNIHDELHKLCTSPGALHIRISALDHPNVVRDDPSIIPGAASREAIEEERLADDQLEEAPLYKSRIRGISPAQSKHAMIKMEWLERAAKNYDDPEIRKRMSIGPKARGVDVANSESGDRAAVARYIGSVLEEVESFQCPDANDLGTAVALEAVEEGINAIDIGVDAIGVGAGCVNEARRTKGLENIQALYSAVPAYQGDQKDDAGKTWEWVPDANRFYNLRAQMWWTMREDLRLNRLAIRRSSSLFKQLTSVEYRIFSGQVRVEEKDDIRKRLGSSPNDADAAIYGNFVRTRAVMAAKHGYRTAEQGRDPQGDYDELVERRRDEEDVEMAGIRTVGHDFEQLGGGF